MCGLFLSIVDSKIYLIHQTAREFLVCEDPKSRDFSSLGSPSIWKQSFHPADSNLVLANICKQYLRLLDLCDGSNTILRAHTYLYKHLFEYALSGGDWLDSVSFSEWFGQEQSKVLRSTAAKLREYKHEYCLLYYASLNWGEHYRKCQKLQDNVLHERVAFEMYDKHCETFRIWQTLYSDLIDPPRYPRDLVGILSAAYHDHQTAIELMSKKDSSQLNAQDSHSRTGLMFASMNGHITLVVSLLGKLGPELNRHDAGGQTSLFYAVQGHHETLVKLLLEEPNIEVNCQSSRGLTPLSQAAMRGDEVIVKLLLKHRDIKINLQDSRGRTPLFLAVDNTSRTSVVALLLNCGADPDLRDHRKRTPLWAAANRGCEALVRELLNHGIDADVRDSESRTPLSIAATKGHASIVELLLSHGASPSLGRTEWPSLSDDMVVEYARRRFRSIEDEKVRQYGGCWDLGSVSDATDVSDWDDDSSSGSERVQSYYALDILYEM